jgi:hypothetical protein
MQGGIKMTLPPAAIQLGQIDTAIPHCHCLSLTAIQRDLFTH